MFSLILGMSIVATGIGQTPQQAPPNLQLPAPENPDKPRTPPKLPDGQPSIDPMATPSAPTDPRFEIKDDGSPKEASSKLDGADKSKIPFTAGWDNGFFLRSEDKKFQLRITGQIQADYRMYVDQPDAADINTFLLRRARFGLEATMYNYFEFRFLPDFGGGATVDQDSYLNVHYVDWFQFEAGRFKQPFSYEQLIQDRFVPTMERSLIDQLVPQRDWGAMIHGQKLLDDRLDYYVSVHNGIINGNVVDNDDAKDVTARVVARPLNSENFPVWMRLLQFGMCWNSGYDIEAANPGALKTPLGVTWLTYLAGTAQNGWRNRYSPDLSFFYGSFGICAQYLYDEQTMQAAAAGSVPIAVPASGFQVLASFLLTGEKRTSFSHPIVPNDNFDPHHPLETPGALELVVRTSRLVVDPLVFQTGANRLVNPAFSSNGCTELTVGMNWYLNAWVRVQANYERAWFDQPITLPAAATGSLHGNTDTLAVRFQIIF
jgi:phosphate-selective porin OprO/OprP